MGASEKMKSEPDGEKNSSLESPFQAGKPASAPSPPGIGEPGERREDWQEELCRFHFGRHPVASVGEPKPGSPLNPASASERFDPAHMWSAFPLYLPLAPPNHAGNAEAPAVIPLTQCLVQALEASGQEGAEAELLGRNLWRLARAADHVLKQDPGSTSFGDVY